MPIHQRPGAVVIAALLDIILGVLILLTQIIAVIDRALPGMYPPFPIAGVMSIIISIVIAAVNFILAYGVLRGHKWAWYFSLAFSAVGIAGSVFGLFARPRAGELILLVVELIIIYTLMQPDVHLYFTGSSQLTSGSVRPAKPNLTQAP